jgi:hypothetical protein
MSIHQVFVWQHRMKAPWRRDRSRTPPWRKPRRHVQPTPGRHLPPPPKWHRPTPTPPPLPLPKRMPKRRAPLALQDPADSRPLLAILDTPASNDASGEIEIVDLVSDPATPVTDVCTEAEAEAIKVIASEVIASDSVTCSKDLVHALPSPSPLAVQPQLQLQHEEQVATSPVDEQVDSAYAHPSTMDAESQPPQESHSGSVVDAARLAQPGVLDRRSIASDTESTSEAAVSYCGDLGYECLDRRYRELFG